MSTFSKMAEEWMRSNKPLTEVLQAATELTGDFDVPDLAEWQGDFDDWKAQRCVHREDKDDWGGISALLVDFAEWCVARNAVPCSARATFEQLITAAGFHLNEGMVAGLVLRVDLEAVLSYQAAPETNKVLELSTFTSGRCD